MKKVIFFATFISLVFLATTVSAEEKAIEIKGINQDIVADPSWILIDTMVDEQTGVSVEIYESKEIPYLTMPMAGDGTWNYVTQSTWFTSHADPAAMNFRRDDKIVHSTGGDFMVTIPYHQVYGTLVDGVDAVIAIELYEEDPTKSNLVRPGLRAALVPPIGRAKNVIWRDINDYVDGTNKKAEFYAKYAMNYLGAKFNVIYSD
ncbi:hypothetical protein [Ornithinibacillus scapharcae]|uniref:hypothetical protein n=1 Tax=Ornithinibacillus scapharcae TaxID=1147159 RepID=UPI000225B266|nr:hypothetical protein [Ornithinibacillus scapharcae]